MRQGPSATSELFDRFARQKILVVGDVMLDWFIWGGVSRISPEAPVPVVEVQKESKYPGGAANVARNMTPFGTKVELSGLWGTDPNGALLKETLQEAGIGTAFCVEEDGFLTITKTRVVAQHQQVVRIDREKKRAITEELADRLLGKIETVLPELDGIIVEDYGKGLITAHLVRGLLELASQRDLIVTVDPKPGNPIEWKGADTVKPNRSEAFASAGIEDVHRGENVPPQEDEPLLEAGRKLLDQWECRHLMLTLGEQGMLVFSGDREPHHIRALAREVYDVSGAGDTAIAVYMMGRCAGLDAVEAAGISNVASSIVVGKLGTTPIGKEELLNALENGIPGKES